MQIQEQSDPLSNLEFLVPIRRGGGGNWNLISEEQIEIPENNIIEEVKLAPDDEEEKYEQIEE